MAERSRRASIGGAALVAFLIALLAATACAPHEETAAAAAGGPTTSGPAEPTTTTVPAMPLRKVLVMGDSVVWDTLPAVTAGFREAGVEVVAEAFPGTSLLGGTDVRGTFRQVISDHQPDVVIAAYTGVYLPPYPTDDHGRVIELGSEGFWTAWTAAAADATRSFASLGAKVYLVLFPHDRITWAAREERMNDVYRGLRAWYPSLGYIDWRGVVSGPLGAPVDELPIGPDGAMAPVRAPDGGHFSPDATRILAAHLVDTVLRDHGLR